MERYLSSFLTYVSSEKGLSSNTILSYKRDISFFLNFLKERNRRSLKGVSSYVIDYLSLLKSKGFASSSIYRAFISIKLFFRFLKREGFIEKDETGELDLPKIWQLVPVVLTYGEIERLFQSVDTSSMIGKRDMAILELLYATGMRVSELCSLKISDLDEDQVLVKGKGDKERVIPVGEKASRAIDRYLLTRSERDSKELFLTRTGKSMNRVDVWNRVKFYAKRAGIFKNISPHTMRHSFATHLLENGADIRVIQDMLGHADISTTDRYTQISDKHLKKAFFDFHTRS